MIVQLSGENIKEAITLCSDVGVTITPVEFSSVILLHENLLLAEKTVAEYREEYDLLKSSAWQTIEDRPHFYSSLNTVSVRGDRARDREIGFSTSARFFQSSLKVVVVEISNKKLRAFNRDIYHRRFTTFLIEHPTTIITEYETL